MIATEALRFDWYPTDKEGVIPPGAVPTPMEIIFSYDVAKFSAGFCIPEHSDMEVYPWSEGTIDLFKKTILANSRSARPLAHGQRDNMFRVLGIGSDEVVTEIARLTKIAMAEDVVGLSWAPGQTHRRRRPHPHPSPDILALYN